MIHDLTDPNYNPYCQINGGVNTIDGMTTGEWNIYIRLEGIEKLLKELVEVIKEDRTK